MWNLMCSWLTLKNTLMGNSLEIWERFLSGNFCLLPNACRSIIVLYGIVIYESASLIVSICFVWGFYHINHMINQARLIRHEKWQWISFWFKLRKINFWWSLIGVEWCTSSKSLLYFLNNIGRQTWESLLENQCVFLLLH
jgi:hypothetical protein